MSQIVHIINDNLLNKPQIHSEEEIKEAESALKVTFSQEYRYYLKKFGFAVIEGHEFTGLTNVKRLNVVDVTKEEHCIEPSVPSEWYVLEQLNIDGIVIWQDINGTIYQSFPNSTPQKIANSFAEYVELLLE